MARPYEGQKKKGGKQPPGPPVDVDMEDTQADQFDGSTDTWCGYRSTNDLGNAERFICRHGADLINLKDVGWLAWDGQRWNGEDGERQAHLKAQATAKAIRAEAKEADKDRQNTLYGHAHDSGQSGKIAAMQREAAPKLMRFIDDMDTHAMLFNAKNTTIELGVGIKPRDHDRDDMMTRCAPTAFDPTAKCPEFLKFLGKIQPDEDRQTMLQQWGGYNLTGDTSEQMVMLFHGDGGNGKSVLLTILQRVIGDYSLQLPFASLLKDDRKRGSEATPDLARLPGVRMALASEPEHGAKLAEAMIKTMTGGEPMPVRHLNKGFFEFLPQFKLTLSFNPRPSVGGGDKGIWRRLKLVPFEEHVDKDDVGPVLDALPREASGILNWLLEGVEAWAERGSLYIPQSVQDATDAYRADSDPVGQFIEQWCLRGREAQGQSMKGRALFNAYCLWCQQHDVKPDSNTLFGRKLSDRQFKKETIGVVYYRDLTLTKDAHDHVSQAESMEGSGHHVQKDDRED